MQTKADKMEGAKTIFLQMSFIMNGILQGTNVVSKLRHSAGS